MARQPGSAGGARMGWNDAGLLLVVFFWGLNLPLVKIAFQEIDPDAFNGIRFTAAAFILLLLSGFRREGTAPPASDRLRLVGLGLIGHTAYQMLFVHGLARTTATHAALIFGVTPIVVAILSSALKHEKVAMAGWAGAMLAFAGIYLIVSGKGAPEGPGSTVAGDLMVLGAAISWCIYTVLARPLLERHSPLRVTAMSMAWGAAGLAPFTVPGVAGQDWGRVGPAGWAVVVYGCLFALVIPYVLWYRSVKEVGSVRTAIYSNLVPVIGTLSAWIILGERLTLWLGLGAAAIFGGIVLTRLWGIRPAGRLPPARSEPVPDPGGSP